MYNGSTLHQVLKDAVFHSICSLNGNHTRSKRGIERKREDEIRRKREGERKRYVEESATGHS